MTDLDFLMGHVEARSGFSIGEDSLGRPCITYGGKYINGSSCPSAEQADNFLRRLTEYEDLGQSHLLAAEQRESEVIELRLIAIVRQCRKW